MSTLFIVLTILALIVLTIGLINPNLLADKKKNIQPLSRKTLAQGMFVLIAIFFILSLIFSDGDDVDLSQAKDYTIIEKTDFSFLNRKRVGVYIVSDQAKTFEERAQTAMKAALDYCKETNAVFVCAYLEINDKIKQCGYLLAKADYAADGQGISGEESWKWQVDATGETVDPQVLKMTELWVANKKRFKKKDGLIDEGRLSAFIAGKMNVKAEDVKTLSFEVPRKKYDVKG